MKIQANAGEESKSYCHRGNLSPFFLFSFCCYFFVCCCRCFVVVLLLLLFCFLLCDIVVTSMSVCFPSVSRILQRCYKEQVLVASEMCGHVSRIIAKDAILMLEMEATGNVCATLDCAVALAKLSPSVRRTVLSLFVCFIRHMKEQKQERSG